MRTAAAVQIPLTRIDKKYCEAELNTTGALLLLLLPLLLLPQLLLLTSVSLLTTVAAATATAAAAAATAAAGRDLIAISQIFYRDPIYFTNTET